MRIKPIKDTNNFETWVASRFGWRLYNIFFKTYTEKVWGVPANTIGADWASQRIKNLSLGRAILNAILPKKDGEIITTLIDKFKYPKLGPGMMWDSAEKKLREDGHEIVFNAKVESIEVKGKSYKVITSDKKEYEADAIFSSMPLAHLPKVIRPEPREEVKKAGRNLKFRDFLSVALIIPSEDAFSDNWIYIHEPGVKVGRVQNYGSWSPYMVKDNKTCLGLEYFVNVGDELWDKADDDLINMAINEIEKLELVKEGTVEKGYVIRMPKAYPVYDLDYQNNVDLIKNWLLEEHPNIFPMGRNGMHRYNNQDHSMVTAIESIRNLLLNQKRDIWKINVEEEYHEEVSTSRSAPKLK